MEVPSLWLGQFVNKTLHIECHDRRLFQGRMKCVDPRGNVVLENANECTPPKDMKEQLRLISLRTHPTGMIAYESRFTGLVVLPGLQILRLELVVRMDDKVAAPYAYAPDASKQKRQDSQEQIAQEQNSQEQHLQEQHPQQQHPQEQHPQQQHPQQQHPQEQHLEEQHTQIQHPQMQLPQFG